MFENDDINLRRCICADPENCTEPVVGYLCRRGEAGWKQTSILNEALLKECRWSIDDYGGDSVYETQCGHNFYFDDSSSPGENSFKFCAYCGGRLVEVKTSESRQTADAVGLSVEDSTGSSRA